MSDFERPDQHSSAGRADSEIAGRDGGTSTAASNIQPTGKVLPVDLALDYARRGWHVFPCSPADKSPLVARGVNSATTDETTIRKWWQKHSTAMIGVACGEASGVWCLDPDAPTDTNPVDGREEFRKLQSLFAANSGENTHTHITPGGGHHKIYKWNTDRFTPITNREGLLRGKHINVRGKGGYFIAAGSINADGIAYQMADRDFFFEFALAPDWLHDMIEGVSEFPEITELLTISRQAAALVRVPEKAMNGSAFTEHADKSIHNRDNAYAEVALRKEADKLAATTIDRNIALNNAAISLGGLVKAGALTEAAVIEALINASVANGYDREHGRKATEATIKSGMGAAVARKLPSEDEASVNVGPETPALIPEILPPNQKLILSSGEFVKDFIPPDYLLDGVLLKGFVYALTAPTGHGKTAVLLSLTAEVPRGYKFAEREVTKGRVLYFAGENPDDVRMRWIGMAEKLNFDIDAINVSFVCGVYDIKLIEARIHHEVAEIGGVVMVVIDTSPAYFAGDNENDNPQMIAHAQMLYRLRLLPGHPTVLAACHPVKNATKDNLIPRGGGGFLNAIDGNLTAWKGEDGVITLGQQGKFRGIEFEPIRFELVTVNAAKLLDSKGRQIPTVAAMALSKEDAGKRQAKARSDGDEVLLKLYQLKDGPGINGPDLAAALLWWIKDREPHRMKVSRAIAGLNVNKKGQLVEQGHIGYALTAKGKKAAEALIRADARNHETQK